MVANMVDQYFLGASFWGWAGIATAKGILYVRVPITFTFSRRRRLI
jgi:hypothetical protein